MANDASAACAGKAAMPQRFKENSNATRAAGIRVKKSERGKGMGASFV
jgi:hypothetical protein